jgi:hypothetical protein
MTIEELRSYRNAEPFEPFVIFMADGRTIHVLARQRLGFAPWGKVGVFEGTYFHLLAPDKIAKVQMGVLPRK